MEINLWFSAFFGSCPHFKNTFFFSRSIISDHEVVNTEYPGDFVLNELLDISGSPMWGPDPRVGNTAVNCLT